MAPDSQETADSERSEKQRMAVPTFLVHLLRDGQKGRVPLRERELRVDKPRLRRSSSQPGQPGEVEIPAYKAIREHGGLADRMLQILIAGVSTRRYEQVIPEMAETVGVSESQVLSETIQAGERLLKDLAERDFSKLDILAVWIDGIQLGSYQVICAVGVDAEGHKHVLGLREGATENAVVASHCWPSWSHGVSTRSGGGCS